MDKMILFPLIIITLPLLPKLEGSLFDVEENDPNGECLSKILVKHHEAYTLLIKNTDLPFQTNRSLLIFEEGHFEELRKHSTFNMYIFLLKNLSRFNETLWKLYHSIHWNSRGKFLVLLDSTNVTEMDNVFRIAWK